MRTWSKGHKGLRQLCPKKGFNKYTETCKNTLYTQTYKNTQEHTHDMPQNEINCIQIVKLISADFGSV